MGNSRVVSLAAIGLLFGRGTDVTPPPPPAPETPGPVVSVASTSFSWSRDSSIVVVARNPESASVFYACPTVELQVYRDGWRHTPSPYGCPGGALPPNRLASGDSLRLSLPINSDVIPRAGWYRVVFRLYRDSRLSEAWEERTRSSPAFEVNPDMNRARVATGR